MPRDHELDPDRGSSAVPSTKLGGMRDSGDFNERSKDRTGVRDLDDMVEQMPGNRAAKDKQRAYPRDTTAKIEHERKRRKLPAEGETRRPMSARQRDARSVTKNRAQEEMSGREYNALVDLLNVGETNTWVELNDRLSAAVGDRQNLDEKDQQLVGRLDRTIQRFERDSDRGHVVYVNMQTPSFINRSNLGGFAANQFKPGTVVEFDRYSVGAHNLHEVEPEASEAHRTVAFEIQTRRGMYLGGSSRVDDTSHLLPRSPRMVAVGSHTATYERPDGTTGERVVVQLVDDLDPSLKKESR